jgi:hypothetical protein
MSSLTHRLTAAEQHHEWGASVEADGDRVILQVGRELVALRPEDGRRFAWYLAHAYLGALGQLTDRIRSSDSAGLT